MNTTLCVMQGVLTAFFIYASLSKLLQTREQQIKRIPEMTYVSGTQVKLIGLAELLGAIGVTAPMILGVYPILIPFAAVGLALIMLSATIFHIVHRSYKPIAFTMTLMVMSAFVACRRF